MARMPTPDAQAPDLKLPLIIGPDWHLAAQSPDSFTMIVVYRGLHCPMCEKYLKKIVDRFGDWTGKGFNLIAVSMDEEDRAKKAHADWGLGDLPVGYGLTEAQAADWGLYISDSIKDAEPRRFTEPGMFWVRPDGRLYLAEVSNSPFARPDLDVLLDKADFIIDKDYPARGSAAA